MCLLSLYTNSKEQIKVRSDKTLIKKSLIFILTCLLFNSVYSGDKSNPKVVITDHNNYLYRGRILCVNDSLLLLWLSNLDYDPAYISGKTTTIPVAEIKNLHVYLKTNKKWKGFFYGFAISGGCGACYGFKKCIDDKGFFSPTFELGEESLKYGLIAALPGGLIGTLIGSAMSGEQEYDFQENNDMVLIKIEQLRQYAMFKYEIPIELNQYLKKMEHLENNKSESN